MRMTKLTSLSSSVLVASVLGALGVLGAATPAAAGEPMPTRADRVQSPGRAAASEDTAEALALNPANVAYLPSWELRWTGVACLDAPAKVNCGHAFSLATPLAFGLSTGLRIDYLQPVWTAGLPYSGRDYLWATWGLGYKISDGLAIGATVQHSYSQNSYTNALTGLSAGVTVRPSPHLAMAVVANNFNGPSTQSLPPNGQPVLDQSYTLAWAFRPTGRRALELGLDLRYLQGTERDDSGQWLPRGSLQIDIPGVGRARGDIEVAHLPNDQRRAVVGTAGLELAFENVTAGAGALFGNGLGTAHSTGLYGTLAISGYEEPGIPAPERAVYIRLESTPGVRKHIALLRRLWSIADDREIAAVTLVLRAEPAGSYAHAEEIADAIRVLRARGKKVLCSWEDNSAKSLYVCANADRTLVNPAGGLRFAGLKTEYIYLRGLLDKLGIRADILRISDHKAAPEQVTNDHASDTARADHEDLLANYEAVYVKDVAVGRKLSEDRVRKSIASGPFVASEARAAGFVDGYAFDDEIERATSELVGHKIRFEKYEEPTKASPTFGPRGRIGLLLIDGDMVDGRSQNIPLVDIKLIGSYSIAESIRGLKDDPTVRAVVMRIESGGGSSMAADVMWRELEQLAKKKPLIVSMGSTAASGGYYIAAPARTIYAEPLTVTGSIGIFYGKADLSGLLQKLGVNVEVYKTAPRADAESWFRPFSDDERQALGVKIHQFYDVFLERVSAGRHMTKAQVDAVGQGRVWTGQEALERRLVDKLGGLREALAEARAASGLPYDAPIFEVPPVNESLLEKALDLVGLGHARSLVLDGLPVQVKDVARAVAPLVVFKSDTALARMEWVPIEDPGTDDE